MFPIKWFWKHYKNYSKEKDIPKIILLFVFSLFGVFLFIYTFINISVYLLTEHFYLLILLGIIFWLYTYVKDNFQTSESPKEVNISSKTNEQAEKWYPLMRNIMYQTVKEIASDIGGKIPRLLNEIEMPEEHYILTNNICFYQFRLKKADIKTLYTSLDLKEFKDIIQSTVSDKIRLGSFPRLNFDNCIDKYGNWHDMVIIDTIEDLGNCFVIQAVFCTPEYLEYAHQIYINQDASNGHNTPLETQWKDKQ